MPIVAVHDAMGLRPEMISVQSIAVAVEATGMTPDNSSGLFRFTIKHGAMLMMVMAVVAVLCAYVVPGWDRWQFRRRRAERR